MGQIRASYSVSKEGGVGGTANGNGGTANGIKRGNWL